MAVILGAEAILFKFSIAVMSALGLKQHPDKTRKGRISKGFDYLGLQFEAGVVLPCKKALQRFVDKLNRLYEQEPDASKRNIRLGQYIRWWMRYHEGCAELVLTLPSAMSIIVKCTATLVLTTWNCH